MVDKYSLMERDMRLWINKYLNIKVHRNTINILRILFQASLQNNKYKKKPYSLTMIVLVINF